jgi:hypothetical protein
MWRDCITLIDICYELYFVISSLSFSLSRRQGDKAEWFKVDKPRAAGNLFMEKLCDKRERKRETERQRRRSVDNECNNGRTFFLPTLHFQKIDFWLWAHRMNKKENEWESEREKERKNFQDFFLLSVASRAEKKTCSHFIKLPITSHHIIIIIILVDVVVVVVRELMGERERGKKYQNLQQWVSERALLSLLSTISKHSFM